MKILSPWIKYSCIDRSIEIIEAWGRFPLGTTSFNIYTAIYTVRMSPLGGHWWISASYKFDAKRLQSRLLDNRYNRLDNAQRIADELMLEDGFELCVVPEEFQKLSMLL